MSTIATLSIRLALNTAQFAAGATESVRIIDRLQESAESATSRLASLTAKATAAAAALIGVGSAAGALGIGVKLAADFEQARISFTVMLGSAGRALKLLTDLRNFAAATPFELPELVGAARSLVAFGVAGSQILPTLKNIGDAAAGLNVPIGELAELYGKARVQGRLFQQDINQLANRGIPIYQSLATQFGVTEGAIRGLVESGQVNFSHLQKALQNLSAEGGQFHNLMQVQSQSIAGLWSTMKDAVGSVLREMGAEFLAAANAGDQLKRITTVIEGFTAPAKTLATILGTIAGWVTRVATWCASWAVAFGKVAAAGYVVVKALGVMFTIWSAVKTVSAAFWIINKVGLWMNLALNIGWGTTALGAWNAMLAVANVGIRLFWAAMGPAGWAILATAVIAGGAAIAAFTRETQAATASVMEFHDASAGFDPAAFDRHTEAMARLSEAHLSGRTNLNHYLEGARILRERLFEESKAAQDATKAAELLADQKQRAIAIIDGLASSQQKTAAKQRELRELYSAGVMTLHQYNAAMLQLADAQKEADKQTPFQKMRTEHLSKVRDLFDELAGSIRNFGKDPAIARLDDLLADGPVSDRTAHRIRGMVAELEALKAIAKEKEALQKKQEDMQRRGEAVAKQMQTPLEGYRAKLAELNELVAAGSINWETYGRAIEAAAKELADSRRAADLNPAAIEKGTAAAFSATIARPQALKQVDAEKAAHLAEARKQTILLQKQLELKKTDEDLAIANFGAA